MPRARPTDVQPQAVARGGVEQAVDLDVLKRFEARLRAGLRLPAPADPAQVAGAVPGDGEDRVRQQMQRQATLRQRKADRIDEKRHVVIDDLHHGVSGAESVFPERGIEYAHQGVAAAPACRKRQVRPGRRGELIRVLRREILLFDVRVKAAQELRELDAAPRLGFCL